MSDYVLTQPSPDNRASVNAYARVYGNLMSEIDAAESDLFVRVSKATRSLRQNAYLHGVVYKTIVDHGREHYGRDVSLGAIHEYLKHLFCPHTVEQIAGEDVRVFPTTTALTKGEFFEYTEHCIRWAAERGIVVPAPDWNWRVNEKLAEAA